jgi:hypothetical protein
MRSVPGAGARAHRDRSVEFGCCDRHGSQ